LISSRAVFLGLIQQIVEGTLIAERPPAQIQHPNQPCLVNPVEVAPNVGVEYPVHRRRLDRCDQCVHCIMLASSRTEPVREAEEVFRVDRIERPHHGPLDDLVLQRRDPLWTLLSARLWNEPPPLRLPRARPESFIPGSRTDLPSNTRGRYHVLESGADGSVRRRSAMGAPTAIDRVSWDFWLCK
jgi:hypothetical protein